MPRKKRDPGQGITIYRYFTPDADDGALFNKLAKKVLGVDARFDLFLMRKGVTNDE